MKNDRLAAQLVALEAPAANRGSLAVRVCDERVADAESRPITVWRIAALFLAADESAMVTGSCLMIDGGDTMLSPRSRPPDRAVGKLVVVQRFGIHLNAVAWSLGRKITAAFHNARVKKMLV